MYFIITSIGFPLFSAESSKICKSIMIGVYQNDLYYVGQINKQDQPHGFGKININSQNIEFGGEIDSGRYKGYGNLTCISYGYKFEGQFLQNYINGYGIEQWKDNAMFKGEFVNDCKEMGIYTWPDNSTYEGYFKDNLFHGSVSF